MKAVKLNRVYTITEAEQKNYQKQGYDIVDDDGNVIAYGFGKTISYEKYVKLLAKYEDLLERYEALEKEIAALTKAKKTKSAKQKAVTEEPAEAPAE